MALPAKWDSIAQLFMQRSDLTTALTFNTVSEAIRNEWECAHRPIDESAQKLSAVRCKGPDPSYHPQQQQQSQPGPSRQPQQGPRQPQQQQQGRTNPKVRTCGGGRQEKARRGRGGGHPSHGHSHMASAMEVDQPEVELSAPSAWDQQEVEPFVPSTWASTTPPPAPTHTSVASFNKDSIVSHKQALASLVVSTPLQPSIWLSFQEAREICDSLQIPKTAKNLKPLEILSIKTAPIPLAERIMAAIFAPTPASSPHIGDLSLDDRFLKANLNISHPSWSEDWENHRAMKFEEGAYAVTDRVCFKPPFSPPPSEGMNILFLRGMQIPMIMCTTMTRKVTMSISSPPLTMKSQKPPAFLKRLMGRSRQRIRAINVTDPLSMTTSLGAEDKWMAIHANVTVRNSHQLKRGKFLSLTLTLIKN